ncbi:MAG: D-amino acid dehydrogenase [Pseudomonadota bacterium]
MRPLSVHVVGAGIVGAAAAYVLARAGHRVTLLEACEAPGRMTSFANGAQLSYSYVEPLATPATLRKLPSMLLDRHSPLRFKLTGEWSQLSWGLRFLRACNAAQVRRATQALLRLSFLSRDELETARAADDLRFDHAVPGKLVVLDTPKALEQARRQVEYQRTLGCEQRMLDAEECIAREPALAAYRPHVAGGVWTPGEAVGDAWLLTRELVDRLRAMGGLVRYRTRVSGFRTHNTRVQALRLEGGDELPASDAVVLANGSDAAPLARGLGLKLPLYPVKGYSITLPVRDAGSAPRVSVTDLRRKTVYAPLPGRLRVAGMAELVGPDLQLNPTRIAHLVDAARETFPDACDYQADPQPWTGLRPCTPTSMPVIGATPYENLWLNVGHGSLGLTLAMGSARLVERCLRGDTVAARDFAYVA